VSSHGPLARAIVSRGAKSWLVSTINRESSATEYVGTYAETLVWEWDDATKQRGEIVWQGESSRDSLRTHDDVVCRLFATGDPRTDAEKEDS
jgi:hypothetical protein